MLKVCAWYVHGYYVDSVVSDSLEPCGPIRLLYPWDSPGKNTGMGCHFLLQEIFPILDSNSRILRLLHWQAGSLPLVSASLKTGIAPTNQNGWSHYNYYATEYICVLIPLFGWHVKYIKLITDIHNSRKQ